MTHHERPFGPDGNLLERRRDPMGADQVDRILDALEKGTDRMTAIEQRLFAIEARQENFLDRFNQHAQQEHVEFKEIIEQFRTSKAIVRIAVWIGTGLTAIVATAAGAWEWLAAHITYK